MAKWLAGQTSVLTTRVRAPPASRFSVQCKVIALPDFYDAITGPTEFIIIYRKFGKNDKYALIGMTTPPSGGKKSLYIISRRMLLANVVQYIGYCYKSSYVMYLGSRCLLLLWYTPVGSSDSKVPVPL